MRGEGRAATLAILLTVWLAACGERPASRSPAPNARAPSGPVNPDAGVTTYACADGQTITAGYPDRQAAIITYKDHAYTLKLARSASGARYTGYGLQWWVKGAHATIAALASGEESASAPELDCAANPAPSGVTRTSFSPAGEGARARRPSA